MPRVVATVVDPAGERRQDDDALARREREREREGDEECAEERPHGHLVRQPRASVVAW